MKTTWDMGLKANKLKKADKLKKKKVEKKRRRNNAQLVADWRAMAVVEEGEGGEGELTGREKHRRKVEQKRAIRDMLNDRRAQRRAVPKKAQGDERELRKALNREIKDLKVYLDPSAAGAAEIGAAAAADEAVEDGMVE